MDTTNEKQDVDMQESGADQNAIRFNIPVGTSKEFEVAAVHQLPNGEWIVAAWVSEDDVDVDTCATVEGKNFKPKKGDMCRFTRKEEKGALVIEPVDVA